MEAAAAISEQLVARVKASLERRVAKEAEFEGEGAWDEEDNDLLEEQIAPEEVCALLERCVPLWFAYPVRPHVLVTVREAMVSRLSHPQLRA